jgi:hypothetical protein
VLTITPTRCPKLAAALRTSELGDPTDRARVEADRSGGPVVVSGRGAGIAPASPGRPELATPAGAVTVAHAFVEGRLADEALEPAGDVVVARAEGVPGTVGIRGAVGVIQAITARQCRGASVGVHPRQVRWTSFDTHAMDPAVSRNLSPGDSRTVAHAAAAWNIGVAGVVLVAT